MSFESEYMALRKKRKQEETGTVSGNSFANSYAPLRENRLEEEEETFAPVLTKDDINVQTAPVSFTKKESGGGWFQKGAFSDGYDFGDVSRTLLGTFNDVQENMFEAVAVATENIIDSGAELAGQIGGWFGNKDFEEKMYKWANGKDLLQSEKTAKTFSNISNWTNPVGLATNLLLGNGISKSNTEDYSVLGEKSDGLVQSAADMIGAQALKAIPGVGAVISPIAMFNNAYRAEMRNAYENGATVDEAQRSAVISGAAEIIFEQIGGLKVFNKMGLDDVAKKVIAKATSSKLMRTLASYGFDLFSEGAEEVLTEIAGRVGQNLTYMDEESLGEYLTSEEALQSYLDAGIGGAVMGFAGGAPNVVNSVATGTDMATNLTANEEAVVKKVYEAELAKAKENGEKINKTELWDSIVEQMDNGEIDIETIEEVLGGEEYQAYQDLINKEDADISELKNLFEGEELQQQVDGYLSNSQRNELKTKLDESVLSKITSGKRADRLVNSFVERDNLYKGFEADVDSYENEYARKTIQNIMDSGAANNTRRMRNLADMMAKISADKGITFSVTDAKKLANTSLGVDAEKINGYVTEDGITINLDSKEYLNRIVGHEVTHVLEGTEFYDTFRGIVEEYAKTTGEYDARLKSAWSRYKNVDGYKGADGFQNIKKEVVADLAGDYLFTDAEFVKNLSVKNRNIFEKIYDEIKYLCKVATAGSEEARQLLKVKKAFEDAYRAEGVKKTDGKGATFSLSDSDGNKLSKGQQDYFKDSKMRDDNGNLKIMYHGSQDAGFHTFDAKMSDDDTSFFFVDSNDVAASYSGTTETYEAQTIHTAEDMNRFIESIGAEGYEVVEKDGKFTLFYEGDRVADSNTAKGIYEEFCWYEGVGDGDANYKVYLNLTNPLEIDAKGKNWNNISREFSQEVADQYNSLTAEEKGALLDLAEWGDFQTFRDEILSVLEQQSIAPIGEDQKHLASAIDKLGGNNINISNLFSIASDNFSAESIQEFAVKQMNTRDYAKKAKAEGYDGVIFKNIHDNGGYSNGDEGASTVAIAFDSNQIKSVANQNPTADPDIRYSLSEDTDGRKLSKEQQNYFKDVVPELKDKNGNLKVLYHGTPNNFTQFNYDFIGSNGTALGKGFYLTERKDIAEGYVGENGNVMELYANITKPMSLTDMTISEKEYRKFVVAVDKATDGQYLTNFGEVEYEGYNTVLSRALEDYEYNDNDVDLIHSVFNAGGMSWEEGFRLLKDTLGYDGVVENNYAGTGSSVFVPTLPEQIKNVDNKTPTKNVDINLSLSENGVATVKKSAAEIRGEDVRLRQREIIAPVVKSAEETTSPTESGDNVIPVEEIAPSPMAESPLQDWRAMAKEGADAESVIQAATTEAVNNVVSGMTSEELSQKADTALNEFAQLRAKKNWTEAEKVLYRALGEQVRVYELYSKNPELANQLRGTFADDVSPIDAGTEAELNRERLESLDDSDMPPMAEEPYYGEPEAPAKVKNPFDNRDYSDVVHSKPFMEENPEVKPYFIEAAQGMLYDVEHSTKGERYTINDQDGYIVGWQGTKRNTTQDIADLKDGQYHYTYGQIEDALNRIINGEKLNALAKRLEFDLHDRLMNGYTDVDGMEIPANQEYIELMRFKQEMDEAYQQHQESVDYIDDDFAPVAESVASAPVIEKSVSAPVRGQETVPYTKGQQLKLDQNMEEVAEVLTEEPEAVSKERSLWQSFLRNFVDKKSVFETLSLKKGNRELQARADSLHRADSSAQYFMKNGDKSNGVKSLVEMRKTVQKSGKEKAFSEYVYHVHNIDRMSLESRVAPKISELQEQFKGYNESQIEALSKEFIKRKTPEADAEKIRAAREYVRLMGFHDKPVFGDSVTADVSKQKVAEFERNNPEFKEWAKDLYKYTDHLRQMMIDNGIISQETADLWSSLYPHYVPIRRAGKDGAAVNVALDTNKTGINAPIKRATGGNSTILPLFDTLGSRTIQTYNAVAKNRFGVELKNTLNSTVTKSKTTFNDAINSVENHEGLLKEGKDGMMPTFTVFENGERVEFEITEDMFDAMKPTSKALSVPTKPSKNAPLSKKVGYAIKQTPAAISSFRRGVLTEYNPYFMLTNAAKDVQDVLINSQHPGRTYKEILNAIWQIMTKGEHYQERMAHGGESDTYFERDTNTFKEKSTLRKVVGFPLDMISKANNVVEQVPRLAEYIASRKMGRSIDVSMLDAARVTTNFAAGGDITKFANRNGFTFLNASVQGAAQQIRNIREAKHKGIRGWVGLAARYAVAGLPVLLLNHLLWEDDEEYEELSDYVKQDYYIVAKNADGTFVRIPKGRAVSVIQNAFEQMGNLVTGDDEVDFGQFFQLVMNNLAPNNPIDNNIISPIVQAATNKTWYGEDLVPTRLQDLPEAEQYDESTDAISRWLGENTGISPYKINYLLDQYSGVVGDVVLPTLTPDAERGDGSVFTAPLLDKFTTDPVMKNQNVSDFYTLKDELTVKANASTATEEDYLKSSYMNAINSELSELYAEKREIQNDTYLSDADKYAKVRAKQQEIVDLTREAMNSYEDVNIQGTYATVGDVQYRYYTPGEDSTAEPGWRKLSADQIEKQDKVASGLGISASEYWSNKEEYDYAYEKPEKYAVAKAVGGYKTFRNLSSELYDIKADKDSSGKSISGSRKEKVVDYINELDLDYGEKIILFKNEYNADDTYNYDIIDYLNSRRDLSYKDIETILKELGFTVDSNGNIYWD